MNCKVWLNISVNPSGGRMMQRLHKVNLLTYERNPSGREVPATKPGVVDLNQIEYMEADWLNGFGDCVIVRLVSGKEFTVVCDIRKLTEALSGKTEGG